MKVSLRQQKLVRNRVRLYLDIYPPVKQPNGKLWAYENLRLYLHNEPKTDLERVHNKETKQLAETIRAQRQLEIQSQVHGITPHQLRQQSFKVYFRKIARRVKGMSRHNWESSVRYLDLFHADDIRFVDIDLSFCEDFKAFLLDEPQLRESRRGIGHNSALSYYNKFRNALKMAWREKLIPDDFHDLSPGLREKEAPVEFLTMADIRQLLQTPTEDELSKRMVLFGILTGMRFCDIQLLNWGEVRGEPGQYYLQFMQRKTTKHQHMPISDQSFELLGARESTEERPFKGIYYCRVRTFLKEWPLAAGIHKHITFCCLRHTYATLQLNSGTDIYTVSKMLGHRHVKTTQRYTRLLDDKKRETTKRIVIDL
ncbi:site-specific integrase [Mucilaginibacter roseus]|uniref:Site-specific integrase n=1 Tax=Mucilaginibacter roseus TaxID=1528868 RepID=A0ABS8TZR6_9SPHI|nr:site-specific integrase [Mucilaginibacter roseus]MCD8739320.1 site-specific integrase [Mucilaginibacter roseus]